MLIDRNSGLCKNCTEVSFTMTMCERACKAKVTITGVDIYIYISCRQALPIWAFTRLYAAYTPYSAALLQAILISSTCLRSHCLLCTELTSAQ